MNKQTIIFLLGGMAIGAAMTFLVEESRMKALSDAYEAEIDEIVDEANRLLDEYREPDEEPEEETLNAKKQSGLMNMEGLDPKAHRTQHDYHNYQQHYTAKTTSDDISETGEKILEQLMENEHPMDDDEEPSDAISMTPEEIAEAVQNDPNYTEGEKMYERKEAARVKGPSLIKSESYHNDFPEFDKDTLYYYTVNEVLATEDDEIIDNELYIVGDCLDKYDFRHNQEDVIFIRNAGMGTDYQVHKIRGEYFNPNVMDVG